MMADINLMLRPGIQETTGSKTLSVQSKTDVMAGHMWLRRNTETEENTHTQNVAFKNSHTYAFLSKNNIPVEMHFHQNTYLDNHITISY